MVMALQLSEYTKNHRILYKLYFLCCYVQLFAAPGSPPDSSAHGFSRQEHWSGLPFPIPGDFSNPEIKSTLLASPSLAGRFFTASTMWEFLFYTGVQLIYNVVLVSGVWQSDSVIHISILFQILFTYRLLELYTYFIEVKFMVCEL